MNFIYKELSSKILNCAFTVHDTLGCGFLEKVYENALIVELKNRKIEVKTQQEFNIIYHDIKIGKYFADLVIENSIILEIKTISNIENIHRAQLLNYLKTSKLRIGFIINFHNPKLEYERFIF